jgi:hypothetical protein
MSQAVICLGGTQKVQTSSDQGGGVKRGPSRDRIFSTVGWSSRLFPAVGGPACMAPCGGAVCAWPAELCSCPENYGEGRAIAHAPWVRRAAHEPALPWNFVRVRKKERFENSTTKKPAPGLVRTSFLGLKFLSFLTGNWA